MTSKLFLVTAHWRLHGQSQETRRLQWSVDDSNFLKFSVRLEQVFEGKFDKGNVSISYADPFGCHGFITMSSNSEFEIGLQSMSTDLEIFIDERCSPGIQLVEDNWSTVTTTTISSHCSSRDFAMSPRSGNELPTSCPDLERVFSTSTSLSPNPSSGGFSFNDGVAEKSQSETRTSARSKIVLEKDCTITASASISSSSFSSNSNPTSKDGATEAGSSSNNCAKCGKNNTNNSSTGSGGSYNGVSTNDKPCFCKSCYSKVNTWATSTANKTAKNNESALPRNDSTKDLAAKEDSRLQNPSPHNPDTEIAAAAQAAAAAASAETPPAVTAAAGPITGGVVSPRSPSSKSPPMYSKLPPGNPSRRTSASAQAENNQGISPEGLRRRLAFQQSKSKRQTT
ncbi:trinucleotide repeat-containing gene 18 protein [Aplysia californica]|uniref:Trinucleotide repeat-containing gene 18 protein n=1 Tax=Aplysia californica TaxID=6500 RepID=A0ABM0JF27_APLCA|nr:trinucleotide repeat-containing gene 18 protein [Aplysia californica]